LIPVFINNRDNLERGFRRLVAWLLSVNASVVVIDNGSTYPPLLQYYEESKLQIIHSGSNLGPYAFWHLGLHLEGRFIVTDPDVVPSDECPADLIERMSAMMDKGYKKVGPSLRLNNLPGCYENTEKVRAWESQFWQHPVDGGFQGLIDTTFAMYEGGSVAWPDQPYLRLAHPYSFEHIPWYEGPEPNAERDYYHAHAKKEWINW
jgi:hypothetical protein